MIIKSQNLHLGGPRLFTIKKYQDNRGSLSEVFLMNTNLPEFNINYVQENESVSKKGVFRGMHFQKGKYSQSKLIRVVKGKVTDFICDLRKSSKYFKKIIIVDLNPSKILFVPKGFAHGFLSLTENTILNYKCDNFYNPKYESGFNLFNSDIDINLNFNSSLLMSDKDNNLPSIEKCYHFD